MLLPQLNNVLMLAAASCQKWLGSALTDGNGMNSTQKVGSEAEQRPPQNAQLSLSQLPIVPVSPSMVFI